MGQVKCKSRTPVPLTNRYTQLIYALPGSQPKPRGGRCTGHAWGTTQQHTMAQSKDPNFKRRQSVTFTLPAVVVDALDAIAVETRRSKSSFAEEALEELLKKYQAAEVKP